MVATGCSAVLQIEHKFHLLGSCNHGQKQLRQKRPVSLNAWVFQSPILHFEPLSPFQCCKHVKLSTEGIKTLKRGRGRLAIDKRMFFLNYGRTTIKSVCFGQMCQHFCSWLWLISSLQKLGGGVGLDATMQEQIQIAAEWRTYWAFQYYMRILKFKAQPNLVPRVFSLAWAQRTNAFYATVSCLKRQNKDKRLRALVWKSRT